jgi:serine/threonine protein kinase
LESVIPNATESMLDLIRHFLFFNPNQRWSADTALRHVFFSETEEPVHTIVPTAMNNIVEQEPITPPDPSEKSPITPFNLLSKFVLIGIIQTIQFLVMVDFVRPSRKITKKNQ